MKQKRQSKAIKKRSKELCLKNQRRNNEEKQKMHCLHLSKHTYRYTPHILYFFEYLSSSMMMKKSIISHRSCSAHKAREMRKKQQKKILIHCSLSGSPGLCCVVVECVAINTHKHHQYVQYQKIRSLKLAKLPFCFFCSAPKKKYKTTAQNERRENKINKTK